MRSYEEGSERRSKDKKLRKGRDISNIDESSRFGSVDWPSILSRTPEGLIPDESSLRDERKLNEQRELREDVSDGAREDLGSDLDSITDELSDINQTDLQEDEVQLLGVIAESARKTASLNSVIVEELVAVVSALNDIASSVEPFSGITVSGTNSIDTSGVPQPVIERSDDIDVRTRRVWMRSDPSNSNNIYLGDDDVEPEDGLMLRPGETAYVDIDFRDGQVYMASEEEGATMHIMGVF